MSDCSASAHDVAVWQCLGCGKVQTLALPTTYTIRRECNHWHPPERPDVDVEIWPMAPLNALAKSLDAIELQWEQEWDERRQRERALTVERTDWRFGFV